MNLETTADIELNLKRLFGEAASTAPLGSNERMGRRIFGVDLTRPLTEEQAATHRWPAGSLQGHFFSRSR